MMDTGFIVASCSWRGRAGSRGRAGRGAQALGGSVGGGRAERGCPVGGIVPGRFPAGPAPPGRALLGTAEGPGRAGLRGRGRALPRGKAPRWAGNPARAPRAPARSPPGCEGREKPPSSGRLRSALLITRGVILPAHKRL